MMLQNASIIFWTFGFTFKQEYLKPLLSLKTQPEGFIGAAGNKQKCCSFYLCSAGWLKVGDETGEGNLF